MPKYRNKKRLERYLYKHKSCSDLVRYLLLNGYHDDIVRSVENKGIDIFVLDWEKSVQEIVQIVKYADYEEYDFYISSRTELQLILKIATKEQVKKFGSSD